jgi:RNA polymerase sigma factor (sigma-70 family)
LIGVRWSGGQEAFCEQEYGRLVGSLTLYSGDRELARELAQEALARACAQWPRVSRMAAPGAWVHRVALNLANADWARRRREHAAFVRAAEETVGDPDWSDVFSVRAAVATLPPRQRAALVLRYYADLPVSEVAELMRCREGTVKALTHQAIETLRPKLPTDAADSGST